MKLLRIVVTAALTTGVFAAAPTVAQADTQGLYWSNTTQHTLSSGTFGGSVSSSTLADVGVTPWGVATDGSYLYWTNIGGIGRTPIAGGSSDPLFVPGSNAMNVAVNSTHIYFTQGTTVARAPIAGGTATTIVEAGAATNAVAVDGTYVYWTTPTTIGRAKLNGDDPNLAFVSTFETGGGLVVTTDAIYMSGYSGVGIGKAPITGGSISNELMPMSGAVNAGLATDGTYLYWADTCVSASSCPSPSYRHQIGRAKLSDLAGTEDVDFITGLGDVYGLAALTQTLQTITFTKPSDIQINKGPVTLSATSSSGLTVAFESSTPTVCTVSGDKASLLSAGTCTITASQAGDASVSAASPVTQSFAVTGLPGALATLCPTGSCAGKDISNANLSNQDLSGIDFTGAIMTSTAIFTGANLTGANLTNVITDNVSFAGATFTNATLSGMQTNNTQFNGATFSGTLLTNNNFKNSDFSQARFTGATVLGSVFYKCKLPFSLFVDTKLFRSGVQLRAKAKTTSFVGANLKGAKFTRVDARSANFSKANLTKAVFTKGDVSKANFKGATLKGTKFKGTKTKGAKGL